MKFLQRGFFAVALLLIAASQLAGSIDARVTRYSDGSADQAPSMLVIERDVKVGTQIHLLVTAEEPLDQFRLQNGGQAANEIEFPDYQGPPYARMFKMVVPAETDYWNIELVDADDKVVARTEVAISGTPSFGRSAPLTGVWEIETEWNASWERVFSFWVAYLFRPLPDQKNKGWKPLDSVLTSETRNFLYNRLGHEEDSSDSSVHVRAKADCGDLPYQLRAYFAWKFGLPFRFRYCDRGDGVRGPHCRYSVDNREDRYDDVLSPVERFNKFIKESIAWHVHSGTLRTIPEDEDSDFYPIPLNRNSIRPGTVFVDVGSHALMVTQWNKEGLFAVDGHPDDTVTRKQFSPKNFKHFAGQRTGGFKAFRPIQMQGDEIVPLSSDVIGHRFSLEQYRYSKNSQFYRHMSNLIGLQ